MRRAFDLQNSMNGSSLAAAALHGRFLPRLGPPAKAARRCWPRSKPGSPPSCFRNRGDIEDVPEQALNRIRFAWVEGVDDDTALNPPQKARAGSASTGAEAGGARPVTGRIDGYSTRGFDPRN